MRWFAGLAALIVFLGASPAAAQQASQHTEINQAWVYLEAGNYSKAEDTLKTAYQSTTWGPVNAELFFALSAIFWERRNAMASYQWLSEAVITRTERHYDWQPGDGWDARIDKRKRFLERNFAIVKLSMADGRSVPPLQDPPSRDPVVRAFADEIAERVEEADKESQSALWMVIPKGTYWVGDELMTLEPGKLGLSEAVEWNLAGNPAARSEYKKRAAEIAAGRSPAKALAEAEAAAAAEAAAVAAGGEPGAQTPPTEAPVVAARPAPIAAPTGPRLGSGVRVAAGGGAALGAMTEGVGGGPRLNIEAGYEAAVGDALVALRIGGQYDLIPVPACGSQQASAMLGGLHVGPRLAPPIADGVWLSAAFGLRLGGGRAMPDGTARTACGQDAVDGVADAWEVPVSADGLAGSVPLSELGWRGYLIDVGPFGDIGVMVALSEGGPRLGFGVQLAYDQLLPVLPGTREVRFRSGAGIGKTSVGPVASEASLGRFTVAIRGVVLVP